MSSSQEFVLLSYNTYNDQNIKIDDAVKISLKTKNLPIEHFWVSVKELLDNDNILCIVQNKLLFEQPINYLDEIIINKSNIKEYKEKNKRFILPDNYKEIITKDYIKFIETFNRMPTMTEFEIFCNIKKIKTVEQTISS